MKRNVTVFSLAALLLLALSLPAFAATKDAPDNPPAGSGQALTEKQLARFDALYGDYENKVMPLHDKLWGKFLELRALEGLSSTSKDDVVKVVDEITSLRTQIRAEHSKFNDALAKEGLPRYPGYHGRGWRCGGSGYSAYAGCPGMGGYSSSSGCPGMDGGYGGRGHGGRGHGGYHGGSHDSW